MHEPEGAATGARALLGDDPAIKRARASIEQLALRSRMPTLFLGEVGTGKRHSARLLHFCTYPDGEFFELKNNEQLPPLERKLAALRVPSSAQAIGGISVYVSELSETSKGGQAALAKLLRDYGLRFSVDRVLAASPGSCRWRGSTEVGLGLRLFNQSGTTHFARSPRRLTAALGALRSAKRQRRAAPFQSSMTLSAHVWPGNLTELAQLVERLQRLENPGRIEPQHLLELGHRRAVVVVNLPPSGIDLADLERELLVQALALSANNRSRAARLLGLTRDQIRYRLSKLELNSGSERE